MVRIPIIFILLFLLLFSCKKVETKPKLELVIYSSSWDTTITEFDSIKFINIHLKVNGYTNAALVSITNGGDGISGCSEIKCNNGKFSSDNIIFFFPSYSQLHRKFQSTITAYSSREKPNIIWYCDAIGSGDTICKQFVSDYLP